MFLSSCALTSPVFRAEETTIDEQNAEVEMADLTETVDLGPGIRAKEVAWSKGKRIVWFD